MRAPVLALTLALGLAACDRAEAPEDPGVCWRIRDASAGAAAFTPLARNVGSLETCAVLLEAHRLLGERDTNGAYQGYFIFVDGGQISSAQRLRGFRFPIFQPPQRAAVDRDLRRLLKESGGRAPDPADITIERNN